MAKRTKRRNNKNKRRTRKKMRGGAAAGDASGQDFGYQLKHIFERVRAGAGDEEIKRLFAKLLKEHKDDCKAFQGALNKIGNDLLSKELEDFFS
jgi:uncharacterized protein YggL (DUF469 family)